MSCPTGWSVTRGCLRVPSSLHFCSHRSPQVSSSRRKHAKLAEVLGVCQGQAGVEYRRLADSFVGWGGRNNLSLSFNKNKETVVDDRRSKTATISGGQFVDGCLWVCWTLICPQEVTRGYNCLWVIVNVCLGWNLCEIRCLLIGEGAQLSSDHHVGRQPFPFTFTPTGDLDQAVDLSMYLEVLGSRSTRENPC